MEVAVSHSNLYHPVIITGLEPRKGLLLIFRDRAGASIHTNMRDIQQRGIPPRALKSENRSAETWSSLYGTIALAAPAQIYDSAGTTQEQAIEPPRRTLREIWGAGHASMQAFLARRRSHPANQL